MRKGELSRIEYCCNQAKPGGKYHLADKHNRPYLCGCSSKWALQSKLGFLSGFRTFPPALRRGADYA